MLDVRDEVVFLSGPMGGIPDSNAGEFARVERELYAMGAILVYNPSVRLAMWHGRRQGWTPEQLSLRALSELCAHTVSHDGTIRRTYDLMVQLDGWERHHGCVTEAHVADSVGIPRVDASELRL